MLDLLEISEVLSPNKCAQVIGNAVTSPSGADRRLPDSNLFGR